MSIIIDLDDFDDSDIESYAENSLNMVHIDKIKLEDYFDNTTLLEYLEDKGYLVLREKTSVANVSTFWRLFRNINNIPLICIEELLDKNNCI